SRSARAPAQRGQRLRKRQSRSRCARFPGNPRRGAESEILRNVLLLKVCRLVCERRKVCARIETNHAESFELQMLGDGDRQADPAHIATNHKDVEKILSGLAGFVDHNRLRFAAEWDCDVPEAGSRYFVQ